MQTDKCAQGDSSRSTPKVVALVTAYHPDERLGEVVEAALRTCHSAIVIDNTPSGNSSASEDIRDPRVRVERPGRNEGLAAALNAGLGVLPEDAEAVLLLDQDSELPENLVPQLTRHLADPTIAAVGPAPYDAGTGEGYERLEHMHEVLADRYSLITSGMLVRREAFDVVPSFRTDFFVDWVDNDFCLRLRRAGLRVVLDRSTRLPHAIGDGRTHRVLGRPIRVLHHDAWRHYWIARNGLILFREHAVAFPGWGAIYVLYMGRTLTNIALFGPDRSRHLRAFGTGLSDALRNRVSREYLPAGADYQTASGSS